MYYIVLFGMFVVRIMGGGICCGGMYWWRGGGASDISMFIQHTTCSLFVVLFVVLSVLVFCRCCSLVCVAILLVSVSCWCCFPFGFVVLSFLFPFGFVVLSVLLSSWFRCPVGVDVLLFSLSCRCCFPLGFVVAVLVVLLVWGGVLRILV